MPTRLSSRWPWACSAALTGAAIAVVGRVGVRQESAGVRVLGALDPIVEPLRASGASAIAAGFAHAPLIAAVVVVALGVFAALALRRAGREAAGFVVVASAFALASLAEAALLADVVAPGAALYGLSFAIAIVGGVLVGRHRSAIDCSAPSWAGHARRGSRWWWFEPALSFAMLGVALLMRAYALTELSAGYESEMMISMLSSRTLVGLRKYVPFGLISNTNGLAHLLPQWLSFSLLGTSVFSIRYTAAACGVVCIALFYALARRLCRPWVAILVTLLFLASPEQLSWARQENTPFQFVTLSALITGNVALRFIDRPGFRTLLALCLWLPLSRYFYGPGMVMMLIPPIVYGHALLFVRGTWRGAWYAVPMLILSLTVWVFSLTIARGLVTGDNWSFIHPAESSGGTVWEAEGAFRGAGVGDLVKLHAANLAKNLTSTAISFTYNGGFTDWYERVDRSSHPTFLNAAVPPLVVAGLGMLVGQLAQPRAFLLLVWIGLGLLPAVLSIDPAPRRMGGAFPALYLVVGVFFSVIVAELRRHLGRVASRLAHLGIAAGIMLIAWTSATSYFLLPMRLTFLDPWFRATRPVFERSDAIYYNLIPHWAMVLAWGHADVLFRGADTPCFDPIGPGGVLAKLLTLSCKVDDNSMAYSLSTATLDEIRRRYNPKRLSVLLRDEPPSAQDLQMLRDVFPDAATTTIAPPNGSVSPLRWVSVDRDAVDALRTPVLDRATGGDSPVAVTNVLADVSLRSEDAVIDGQRIRASLLVERSTWYRLTLSSPCDAAKLEIDQEERPLGVDFPLTRGAHSLRLALPAGGECSLPTRLRIASPDAPESRPAILVAPKLAGIASVRGQPLVATPGYDHEVMALGVEGAVVDAEADGSGGLWLLSTTAEAPRMTHLAASGEVLRSFAIPAPRPIGVSIAPDGTLFLPYGGGPIRIYHPDGSSAGEMNVTEIATADLGHLPDGSVLLAAPSRNGIDRLDRNGHVLATWTDTGVPETRFAEPWSVRVSREGDVVVAETDGTVLVFATPLDHFAPTLRRTFKLELRDMPTSLRGWMLDGVARQVIVPDPAIAAIAVVDLDGTRRLSRDPARDLHTFLTGPALRVTGTASHFFVVEPTGRVLKVSARDAE